MRQSARWVRSLIVCLCVTGAGSALAALTGSGNQRDQPGTEWFVAPDGLPSNDGSRARPFDLATALDGRRIKAGSTIWLRGGVYRGSFRSALTGTAEAPITVRPYAGERAVIADDRERADGATLNVRGAWTIYRDFEVTNTNTNRGHGDKFRPMGFEVQAPHTKFINLAVYDTGMGFGFWKEAVDSELYGNVIFNSGTENTSLDFRHGHGIYTQNDSGTKLIRENVIVNQFGFGIHVYPNPGGQVGFRFEGNVVAASGAANPPGEYSRYNNVLVSAYRPYQADRIELVENFTYLSEREKLRGRFPDANVCLGCTDPQRHKSIVVRDNYFAGGAPVAVVAGWQALTMRGNTFVGMEGMATVEPPGSDARSQWDWDENTYIGSGGRAQPDRPFVLSGKPLEAKEWVAATGFDRRSKFSAGRPTGTRIFVRPNAYEPGRGHLVIYNWDQVDRVSVDLGAILKRGARYEVVNAMDYLGDPVASGVFEGASVTIPLGALRIAQPLGARATPPARGGEFGVFVVRTVTKERPPTSAAPTPPTPPETRRPTTALSRFVGRFVSRVPPGEVVISLEGDTLTATILNEPGRPMFPLVPVAPGRFRVQGAPAGFFAIFDVDSGPVRQLTLERGNNPRVVLVRH